MLSVSELNEQAKALLETTFSYVEVEGEISRLTRHNSGHWYFTLKDEKASVSAVIYKFNNAKIKFEVKDGMKVVLYGKVSLYTANGSYQLIATSIKPSGEGELELAFKQLKTRLEAEGLFDVSRKKPLPKFPRKVGIITSRTSAALQDMLRLINERWLLSEIYLFDSLTQGQSAPEALIRALKRAEKSGLDVIIIARGGGSREDLWCFNDEGLAREIYAAKTPIISAIGHEIDYVISDFAADFRAPTPSAAINSLMPDSGEILQTIDEMSDTLKRAFELVLQHKQNALQNLQIRFSRASLEQKIENKMQILQNFRLNFKNAVEKKFLKFENRILTLQKNYTQQEAFFSQISLFVRVQKEGKTVSLEQLNKGDEIELSSLSASKRAKIL